MSLQFPCKINNANSTTNLELCKSIENDHENLECYFSIWEKLKTVEFGEMHISVVSEIAASLALTGQYEILNKFLVDFKSDNIQKLTHNERFLRAYIALKFEQRAYRDVYKLLESGSFHNNAGLLGVWDEAHYREKQEEIKRPLTPLIRFRIRKRYPPPPNICPSGERPTSKLTNESREKLVKWFQSNKTYPYPSPGTRIRLARETGLSEYQVKTWFANARRRLKLGLQKYKKRRHQKNPLPSPNYPTVGQYNSQPLLDQLKPKLDQVVLATPASTNTAIIPENGKPTRIPSTCGSLQALANICSRIGLNSDDTADILQMQPTKNYKQEAVNTFTHQTPCRPEPDILSVAPRKMYTNEPVWLGHDQQAVVIPATNIGEQGFTTMLTHCGWSCNPHRLYSVPEQTTPINVHPSLLPRPKSCPPKTVPGPSPVITCWQNQFPPNYVVNIAKPVTVVNSVPLCRLPTESSTRVTETKQITNSYVKDPVMEHEAAQGLLYLSGDKSTRCYNDNFVQL